MDQFSFDWGRHERVAIHSFKEFRAYDYNHTFDEHFANLKPENFNEASHGIVLPAYLRNGQDTEVLNIVDGSNITNWECRKIAYAVPQVPMPLTVGLLINLNNPNGGCNVHCLELFWGTGSRLDREPKRYCIDILPMNTSKFQRIYSKSNTRNENFVAHNIQSFLPQSSDVRLLTPIVGDRFARDVPNITTTRIDFKNTMQIRAIIIKFFDLDDFQDAQRPIAIRQLHVWGRLASDPTGAADVVRNTRLRPPLSELNFVLDSRLFTSPIIGVVAIERNIRARHSRGIDLNSMLQQITGEKSKNGQNDSTNLLALNKSVFSSDDGSVGCNVIINNYMNTTTENVNAHSIVKQSNTSLAEKIFHKHLGRFYNLPFHLVQEIFHYFNYQDLQTFGRITKVLGFYGTYLWTSYKLEVGKQFVNWGLLSCSSATATSRWNQTEDEDPNNLLDGNSRSWWSSASVQECDIKIDLGHVVPVEQIDILWGDDNGRIRPCSRIFTIEVSLDSIQYEVVKRFNGGDNLTQTWRNHHNRAFMPRHDVLDYTTTSATMNERPVRYVKVHLVERAPRWANHAITSINIYGFGRLYENPLIGQDEFMIVDNDQNANEPPKKTVCTQCNTT